MRTVNSENHHGIKNVFLGYSCRKEAFFIFFLIGGFLMFLFYSVWLGVIGRENPKYLSDFRAAVNPDAVTYVQLGKNIWNEGVYSRSIGKPYVPDFKWTPVFPFFAGLADQLAGVRGILLLNISLTFFMALLLARIAFWGTRSKLISCLTFIFSVLDPLIWSVNLQAMSDQIFLFFLILGVYWAFPVLFPFAEEECRRKWLAILQSFCGGLAFALAILARPSGLYVPAVLTIAFFLSPVFRRFIVWIKGKKEEAFRTSDSVGKSLFSFARMGILTAFLAGALGPVIGWMVRNAEVFGKFALCGNQNIVMVYYSGGGAWQTALGCSLEEAQERISREFALPPNVKCQNPEAFGLDQGELDTQLAKSKKSVLLRYPTALAFSSCAGVVKSFLAHETRTLLQIIGEENAQSENFPVWKSWIFVWSIFFQGMILLLAFLAILRSWRFGVSLLELNPALALALIGWCGYFLLTMMLSGIDCCARYRLPLMPVLYFLAAYQLVRMLKGIGVRHFKIKT